MGAAPGLSPTMAVAFSMPCSHYGEKIEAGVVVKNKMSLKFIKN